jgi:hypothetical protein
MIALWRRKQASIRWTAQIESSFVAERLMCAHRRERKEKELNWKAYAGWCVMAVLLYNSVFGEASKQNQHCDDNYRHGVNIGEALHESPAHQGEETARKRSEGSYHKAEPD